jgi:hypothetical protein
MGEQQESEINEFLREATRKLLHGDPLPTRTQAQYMKELQGGGS